MEKMQTVGDVAHMKQTIYELTEELKVSKRDAAIARQETLDTRVMVRELRKEIEGLKERGGIDRDRVRAGHRTGKSTQESAQRSSSNTEGWRTVTRKTARSRSDRTSDGGANWTSRDDLASQSGVEEYGRGSAGAPGAETRGPGSGPPRRGGNGSVRITYRLCPLVIGRRELRRLGLPFTLGPFIPRRDNNLAGGTQQLRRPR